MGLVPSNSMGLMQQETGAQTEGRYSGCREVPMYVTKRANGVKHEAKRVSTAQPGADAKAAAALSSQLMWDVEGQHA